MTRRVAHLGLAEGQSGRLLDGADDRLVEKPPRLPPAEEPVGIGVEIGLAGGEGALEKLVELKPRPVLGAPARLVERDQCPVDQFVARPWQRSPDQIPSTRRKTISTSPSATFRATGVSTTAVRPPARVESWSARRASLAVWMFQAKIAGTPTMTRATATPTGPRRAASAPFLTTSARRVLGVAVSPPTRLTAGTIAARETMPHLHSEG
jgi:hypothetical protein